MIAQLIVLLIRVYRAAISPWLGPSCRYLPTCSEYAVTCVERHGALVGSWYGVRRICRCHPFGGSGYDPPPEKAPSSGASPSTTIVSNG